MGSKRWLVLIQSKLSFIRMYKIALPLILPLNSVFTPAYIRTMLETMTLLGLSQDTSMGRDAITHYLHADSSVRAVRGHKLFLKLQDQICTCTLNIYGYI